MRLSRIERRAIVRFGRRVLPGGDMYEQERGFHAFAARRREEDVEAHVSRLSCPVLRLDGTRPVEENVKIIASEIKER